MPQPAEGCAKPVAGVLQPDGPAATVQDPAGPPQEVKPMLARVGQAAPDFEATAYFNGAFANVRLSDYRGKWILLCFYPGDFTFV
jgi:hypothetical protein